MGAEPRADTTFPWDPGKIVEIPRARFRISGYIDRLDVAAGNRHALVRDYKTGRTAPLKGDINRGREQLQRCLYAYAVRVLLGGAVGISASLHYLRDDIELSLDDPDTTLDKLAGYLEAARTAIAAGNTVMGEDTGGKYDDLAFALPANASTTYRMRKEAAARERLGAAVRVWEAQ